MIPEGNRYCPDCFRSFADDAEECPEHGVKLIKLPGEESLIGQEVAGKYDVLERLGQGGMGTVYRVRQKYIKREVALKVLRGDFAKDVNAVKRFFVEAQAACQLRNRHSVILYDFGLSDEGLLFYTMEMLRGRSLSAMLRKSGPLPAKMAAQIVVDVCHSLEEAHSYGIVHRDLKPDNIMVVENRGEDIAKVLDFGIAKLLTGERDNSLTQTGMLCGTPEYMSPEQAGGKKVGVLSDIYSLGIVLYEMLAGTPPFRDTTPVLVLMKHLNEVPEPISTVRPNVRIPSELDDLLVRMLAKQPEVRPPGAEALRNELEAIFAEGGEKPSGTVRIRRLTMASTGVRQMETDPYNPDDDGGAGKAPPDGEPGPGESWHAERTETAPSVADRESGIESGVSTPAPETVEAVDAALGRRRRILMLAGFGTVGLVVVAVGLAVGLGAFGGSSEEEGGNHPSTAVRVNSDTEYTEKGAQSTAERERNRQETEVRSDRHNAATSAAGIPQSPTGDQGGSSEITTDIAGLPADSAGDQGDPSDIPADITGIPPPLAPKRDVEAAPPTGDQGDTQDVTADMTGIPQSPKGNQGGSSEGTAEAEKATEEKKAEEEKKAQERRKAREKRKAEERRKAEEEAKKNAEEQKKKAVEEAKNKAKKKAEEAKKKAEEKKKKDEVGWDDVE